MERKRMILSFFLGGIAVVLSYLISSLSSWKVLSGIAATFPSVMIISVMMVGLTYGSHKAAEIARGSVFGMAGCALCVIVVLISLMVTKIWWLSVVLGLLLWYVGALFIYRIKEAVKASLISRKNVNSRYPVHKDSGLLFYINE
ncbi:DUF3147 family protein [Brevibacillus ginsengisoli]|uniref:DUF3147 family protein n=1 Tax=Brevibacillus ginsengisoli TaxID=363854 RepID=UPI003CEFDFEC